MKHLLSATVILLAASTILPAQTTGADHHKGRWSKLRKISEIVLIGSNMADSHSSWGYMEANSLLANSQGRFGVRGVAVKGAIVAGWLICQRLQNRHGKYDKEFAIANFALAGGIGAVAVHNYRLPRRLRRR